jgi:uncharacterized protein with PhoU and TrkA domain
VATLRGTVTFRDDNVRVQLGSSILPGYVAAQADHLDLLSHRDLDILLAGAVKKGEHHILQSANGTHLRSSDPVLLCKAQHTIVNFFTLFEHEQEAPGAACGKQFTFHP